MLDWLRLWPEIARLNLQKARHARRLRARPPGSPVRPAPCQSASDSGRAHATHCEACLRFDRTRRFRLACPALVLRPEGSFCSLDAERVRPLWGRAALAYALPIVAAAALAVLVAWIALRHGAGIRDLALADLAWPPRWDRVAEKRRAHFRAHALDALRRGDTRAAGIALFSAAQSGRGDPAGNRELARLATLGAYHSLADELHAATLAAHPEQADEIALAWHDDLLVSGRPAQLARLSLDQLARPSAPREIWLAAFLDAIRHPGVAADLLADTAPPHLPHPGLASALQARAAADRGDKTAAADHLLALSGLPPGQAVRRFLVFSWLDLDEPARARAAALSTAHPAPPGEIAALAHALLRADGVHDAARAALRPLFDDAAPRPLVVSALIRDPDAALLDEYSRSLPPLDRLPPPDLAGLWMAARRAGAAGLADRLASELEKQGPVLPAELRASTAEPLTRERLAAIAGLLPLPREALRALRAAP